MPELPEVERVRQTLIPRILGSRIYQVKIKLAKLARPKVEILAQGLKGQLVLAIRRRGKLLILHLERNSFWTIHLGMTGQLIIADSYPNSNHIHIIVEFIGKSFALFYNDMRQFGNMGFWPDKVALFKGPLARLGPDAWGLEDHVFIERLTNRKAPLKIILLDQTVLAGIGNIYANEILYRAKLSPLVRPIDLTSTALITLNHRIQEVITEAIDQGGSSVRNFIDTKGEFGSYQKSHQVYQRTGQPCLVCGCLVKRIILAGRSTFFCPSCQRNKS